MARERFDDILIELLKTNPDYVDDSDILLREKVKHLAWQFDRDLIGLLLTNEDVESKFFEEINGRWIFNNNTFVDYINDKDFLDDSYTKFRNKIRLTVDDKTLRERGEVSLVWPYKDCVLEGGQTKKEEKRKEIFFNEILAQDEINRLFDPKVLTNWKRHTAEYEEIYLLRNERHFSLFNFFDGRTFQPDFVLFLGKKNGESETYQLFIEPKGGHLVKQDQWKEDFLKEIPTIGSVQFLTEDYKYRIHGVGCFYNMERENEFRDTLNGIIEEIQQ